MVKKLLQNSHRSMQVDNMPPACSKYESMSISTTLPASIFMMYVMCNRPFRISSSVTRWTSEHGRYRKDADWWSRQDELIRILAIACYLACNPCSIVGQWIECVLRWNKACLNFNNGCAISLFCIHITDQNICQLLLHVNLVAVADQVLGAYKLHR